ncbi:Zinc-type alcohol dehydrogenase [Lecanosticta acicola]|uniref:Zinc-type alcohol dehydrogenase n=1 Tax=Lecanosticta acicola TaxID=111012 RepID=A0AAI8Z1Q8_9PEZI|nr:Zinc-type alcohol dehydrogenase [Lecanosticta acicola]
MKAIAVSEYGPIDNLVAIEVETPGEPQGHDLLIKVQACSINPVDTKVRNGTYDDYPDYYSRTPNLPQILGYDGAGIVQAIGPEVHNFKPGDEVFWSGSPVRQGSNAEFQLVDNRSVALKPQNLNMVQAACLPLTWITAWEALVERMGIKMGEASGILIINGAGGVGSIASQIARKILQLPVVITTTSREETTAFSKDVGTATHTINHHSDNLAQQIESLNLDVPIRYVFITHTPASKYIVDSASLLAPFGKVCSIVQDEEIPMYGTEWMAKSLTYIWEVIGTKPLYGVDVESHRQLLIELAAYVGDGTIQCHHTETLPLTLDGVRRAHEMVEASGVKGKLGLSVDAEGTRPEQAFA